MTRRQRTIAAQTHADLILADEPSAKAYAAYFETQMRRGRLCRLLWTGYLWLARTGSVPHPGGPR